MSGISSSLIIRVIQMPLLAQKHAAASLCTYIRQMSTISGKHNPLLDLARETNPMMHQQDSHAEAVAGAFEARLPGEF
jgi:hypothetical protein